jgi:hypothetical protein
MGMHTWTGLLLLALGALTGVACADSDRGAGGADGDADTDTDTDTDGDTDADSDADADIGCDKMDILFVVDDSGSMACEQEMLTSSFPGFIQVLEEYNNANADQISYRIGVTSTGRSLDYSIDAPLFPPIPMSEDGLDGDLVEVDGQKWIDGPGDTAAITAAFAEAASLGTGGPSFEMPLECMREALDKDASGGNNEGFLREDSLFIAVVITDEDDCSRTDNDFTISHDQCMTDAAYPPDEVLVPLQEFKDFLNGRFGGTDRWVFVTISGATDCDTTSWSSDSCDPEEDPYAGAFESVRLMDWMNNYVGVTESDNGVFADICTTNLPDALAAALAKMEVACDEYVIE